MKKILPITTNFPNSYMFLPMSVLAVHDETKDWLHENFINICCDNSKNGRLLNVGNGFLGFYNSVFEYTVSTYDDVNSQQIVERLKSELIKENYSFIYLDEYYVSVKSAYNNYHFRHQSLIYGFDDEKKIFNAIAFDKTGHYAKLEYLYSEVIAGYLSGIQCEDPLVIEPFGVAFFKIAPEFKHKLCFRNIINSLTDYINSSLPKDYKYTQSNLIISGTIVPQMQTLNGPFGLNVVKETADFILYRSSEQQMDFRDFIRVHFLYEHASMLLDRFNYYFNYVTEKYRNDFLLLIESYKDIVSKYMKARLLYLKMETTYSNDSDKVEHQKRYVYKIANILKEIIPQEKKCINNIVEILSQYNREAEIADVSYRTKYREGADYIITKDQHSDKEFSLIIKFSLPKRVNTVCFKNIADITLCADGKYVESVYYSRSISMYDYSIVSVNKNISEIRIHASSCFSFDEKALDISILGGNLLYGKKAFASSMWKVNEDFDTRTVYSPEKALDEDPKSYWRAKSQIGDYDGQDWLEVDLEENKKINRIVIAEKNDYPKITEYEILYCDKSGNYRKLLKTKFISGEKQILDFPEIYATKLRVNFIGGKPDVANQAEPSVVSFEAYLI